ncbi:MAG: hypothetical protein HY695_05885 [Deltaproteobacteria bacterium]|nr:hypothetical protein [Deltaproteobacteria bacterium]
MTIAIPEKASDRKKVRIRYSFSADGIGAGSGGLGFEEFAYFYAIANGIVRLEGIDFAFVNRPGGRPVMNQLLMDREVDVGVISLATLIKRREEGLDLCLLGNEKIFSGGGNSVYVRRTSPIKSAADLGLAKSIIWHCDPGSERLIVQRAIVEKKYGLPWSSLAHQEGT